MIEARDLVVGFGDQIVLDHLSLDVRRGEILGVVGASGSGKSVLLPPGRFVGRTAFSDAVHAVIGEARGGRAKTGSWGAAAVMNSLYESQGRP
jgi:phospholipid/cholesterol/gamma-HCH transport system ATP-binding protein